ncbi:uncharacterized protein MELLADRAFT_109288 [Melampsora larici-populina 98AG31]|uniref:Uncharacterized protein n=1 Tax=Melampsora larici-populina (strain 98AG31 / pathotype 3-4-7) TaxID=747676 RepID=F4RVZ8_MELLP|nr:uncharacterized protein MELLADRAFT_109288 [Melampsora larici-populina 98AG31]EGG03446.1 hypothetical protein MELLADRAFT_109288 [Melampsora larici-populina 98AG31]
MLVILHLQLSTLGYPGLIAKLDDVQQMVKAPLTVEEAIASHPDLSNQLVQHAHKAFDNKPQYGILANIIKSGLIDILSSNPESWSKELIKYTHTVLTTPPIQPTVHPVHKTIQKLFMLECLNLLSTLKDLSIESSQMILSFLVNLYQLNNMSTHSLTSAHSLRLGMDKTIELYKMKILTHLSLLKSLVIALQAIIENSLNSGYQVHFSLYVRVKGGFQDVLESQVILTRMIKTSHLFPLKDTQGGNIFMSWADKESRSYTNRIVTYIQSLENEVKVEEFLTIQKHLGLNGITIFGDSWNFQEKKKILEFWFNCLEFFLKINKEFTSDESKIKLEHLICKDLKRSIIAVEEFLIDRESQLLNSSGEDPLISQFLTFYKKNLSLIL